MDLAFSQWELHIKIREFAPQMAAVPSFHYYYDASGSLFQADTVIV